MLKDKLDWVESLIEEASKRSGRTRKDISLVAVTKGVAPEIILEAKLAGLSTFGENKIQESTAKIPPLAIEAEWHFIGHLQSNKAKEAVELFHFIQSVDTVRIAQAISSEAAKINKVMQVLVEVNIASESQKYGFKPEEVYMAIEKMTGLPNVRVMGLMGIAPNTPTPEPKREAFKKLRNIFSVCKSIKNENLQMRYLSMGMSDDFEIAIEEGANMIRLGRAIFG